MSHLLIIRSDRLSENDAHLAALADFLGIDARFEHFRTLLEGNGPRRDMRDGKLRAAVSGETLGLIVREGLAERLRGFLVDSTSSLFVFGIAPGRYASDILNRLTGGSVKAVIPLDNAGSPFHVTDGCKDMSRQLSGLSIGMADSRMDHTLEVAEDQGKVKTIVSAGERPFFVVAEVGGCLLFVAAGSEVADVNSPVAGPLDIGSVFSRLAPAAIYLKSVFRNTSWHSEESRACLVVDDPLLREKYGFLNYGELVDLMDAHRFTTSIGFIPWNFKRTSERIARLFHARGDRLSLCVHGCDHTKSEFGALDRQGLDRTIRTATERMNCHKDRTGLIFDNIMVFPQGVFSTHAMEALKSNGYLAAVNNEVTPVDFGGSLPLKVFLEPAIMAFGNFPLFSRRFPEQTEEMAWDLFWGRPVLVLTHHDSFKDNCRQVIDSVSRINSIDGKVKWDSLAGIIRRSYLCKDEPGNTVGIKSYVAEMDLHNASPFSRRYNIAKDESGPLPVRAVLQNERETKYELSGGKLRVALTLGPHERRSIRVLYEDGRPDLRPHRKSGGRAAKILIRRYLSEMRDNYISKNEFLLSLATKVKNRLLP